ncbi:MAG: Type 1 glutamine amidotransferase-like domain-containing protein, partial [Burkholderiaceae bacterium]|nr:Type 1 glutamine amidotransferase-like domain-containing protein [Burkholderiaceae bacterium]
GGFVQTDRWGVVVPGQIFKRALELTGKARPRVLFVLTASGDNAGYISTSYQAVSGLGVDVEHLSLFTQPKVHGVDNAARDAWERGAVMAGVSAGSLCWHVGGPTDSFGPKLETITNGLALVPYGNGVHYDTEAQRRPLLQSLVLDKTLPLSFATDDHAAIVYQGIDPVEVVVDTTDSKAKAYRVELVAGEVKETTLAPGAIH